jgi:hypothetical protein
VKLLWAVEYPIKLTASLSEDAQVENPEANDVEKPSYVDAPLKRILEDNIAVCNPEALPVPIYLTILIVEIPAEAVSTLTFTRLNVKFIVLKPSLGSCGTINIAESTPVAEGVKAVINCVTKDLLTGAHVTPMPVEAKNCDTIPIGVPGRLFESYIPPVNLVEPCTCNALVGEKVPIPTDPMPVMELYTTLLLSLTSKMLADWPTAPRNKMALLFGKLVTLISSLAPGLVVPIPNPYVPEESSTKNAVVMP